MDNITLWVTTAFASLSVSSQMIFLFIIAFIFGYLVFKASHREDNALDWVDLITDATGRISLSKLGQFIGIVVSSWVVVLLADKGTISFDIFGLYLAFAGGTAGWSSYLKAKFAGSSDFNTDGNSTKNTDDDGSTPPKKPSANANASLIDN